MPTWNAVREGEGYGTGVYNLAEGGLLQTSTYLCWATFSLPPCLSRPPSFQQNLFLIYGILGLTGMKLKIINITKKFNCNLSIDERQSPIFLLHSVKVIQLKPTKLCCYLLMLLWYLHVLPTFPMVFQHMCPLSTSNIILFFALCS